MQIEFGNMGVYDLDLYIKVINKKDGLEPQNLWPWEEICITSA